MIEVPLFPLNIVLFPGTPIHLQIFEERYKKLVSVCMSTNQPFGVALIKHGVEAFGPLADPYLIGCFAQIIRLKRIDEERLSLTAIGKERFRILTFDRESQPYLIGNVVPFPILKDDLSTLQKQGDYLRRWVLAYLLVLNQAGLGQLDSIELPQDVISLAYIAASLTQISNTEKQNLLSLNQAYELIEQLIQIYRREVALAKALYLKKTNAGG